MNRLTEKTVGCFQYDLKDHKAIPGEFGTYEAFYDYSMAVKRLGEYEDTGLEPEDIISAVDMAKIACALHELNAYKDIGPIDHLRELFKAESEGRLVVLPCKVGDTVYVNVRTFPYNYLHPADGCEGFAKCEIVSIVTTKSGTYLKLRALYPSRAGRRDYLRYPLGAIGKTVFLTREDAEAALVADTNVGNKETK